MPHCHIPPPRAEAIGAHDEITKRSPKASASSIPACRHTRQWIWIAALALGVLFMGSTILTPLYPIYQRRFGFSELTVTMIYAVYVIGNLSVLFFFGRLSDRVGRRRTSLLAFGITVLAALCFLLTRSIAWLFAARVVNGLGASLGATTLTAWIAELDPDCSPGRAAVMASSANLAGLASGALLTGLLARYAPWPLHLIYLAFLALLLGVSALVMHLPETVERTPIYIGTIFARPRIGVPPSIRIAFLAPAALSFTGFALAGFYAALGPALLRQSLHQHGPLIVGMTVTLFFATSAVAVVLTKNLAPRRALAVTLTLLLTGLGMLTLAETIHSMPWLLGGTVASGAALALAYRASLSMINDLAPKGQRAEVVASFQIVHFVANSIPVIGVGTLAWITSAPMAHRLFALVLIALAAMACTIGWRSIRT